ncbi:MAG: 2Fe-2S iron-sulfur cluster-binding protein [Rectinemataceae bacterium]|jgi:succinate dehydrogenase / fumarate reductase iron-sulfur subunit
MSIVRLRVARGAGFAEYEAEEGRTLLDALEIIRGDGETALRYRHSCHHGSCGTCGALVDGVERLMCLTRLADLGPGPVTVESLRKMGAVADIAVDPSPLFAEMPEGSSYIRSSEVAHRAPSPDGSARLRMENCIECGLCVSACPVTAPFSGPAALAAADRDREERPAREAAALAFAAGRRGVAACERRFACSRACPQAVYPGRRIENLRRSLDHAL